MAEGCALSLALLFLCLSALAAVAVFDGVGILQLPATLDPSHAALALGPLAGVVGAVCRVELERRLWSVEVERAVLQLYFIVVACVGHRVCVTRHTCVCACVSFFSRVIFINYL